MLEISTKKNESLNLWEATATLTLPPITVTRLKADRSDFKYEIQRAFTEIVEQVIEKHIED